MDKTYAILGAGMQGTAAAFDLATFGNAKQILLGDSRLEQAQKSADRVNKLVGANVCEPILADAMNPTALASLLSGVDALCSCVPYWMHPKIARMAIASKINMADLGGNTQVTMETLGMHDDAVAAGITLIPDTGLAPGFVNSLALKAIETLDETETIRLFCGVLPQNPIPPFNYKLTFNIEGLVTEYDNQAVVLRDGEIVLVDTLAELEPIQIEQLGEMEAFTTSGGTSTAPYTLRGRIKNYEYKTIRFPGHCERMRIFKDFGFWREDQVEARGGKIKPRDLFCKLFGESLAKIKDLDQCAIRCIAIGTKDGAKVKHQIDVFDKQCTTTGFTAMERLTGFSIAIHAAALAHGEFAPGAMRYEQALTGTRFCEEVQKRGIHLKFSEEQL